MFVFRKIWRALFSCYLRFEIRPFPLSPMNYNCAGSDKQNKLPKYWNSTNSKLLDII